MITEPDWISETYLPEVQSSCMKLKGSQEREVENAPDLQLQRRKFRSFHHRDFIQMWVHRNYNAGRGVVFGWKEGFILNETFERSSSSVCSACAALRCQLSARCFFLELVHAGASTLWLCKILAQAKLGEIWSQCSCTYEVIAKVTACNCVAILCDRKENEVLWAVSSSDELGELHECGI